MQRFFKLFVLLAVMAATVGVAGSALASPPSTYEWDETHVFCGFGTDLGFANFFARTSNLATGEVEPPTAFLVILQGEDEPPAVDTEDPYQVNFGEGSFEGELGLFDPSTGDHVGSATFAGTFEQVGDFTLDYDDRRKEGNVWVEERQQSAPLAVAGSLEVSVDGYSMAFDLSECEGARVVGSYWSTNPTAYTVHASGTELYCDLYAEGWFATVYGGGEHTGGFVDVAFWAPDTISSEDPPSYVGFSEDFAPTVKGVSVIVDLWELMSGEPDGVATIDASFTKGDLYNLNIVFQEGWQKLAVYSLIVEGTLAFGDIQFDMAGCGGAYTEVDMFVHPDLSQGKGKVPLNDLPDGAVELDKRSNDHTRMASPEPEAACFIEEYGEDIPLGKTLWYEVVGTGRMMTIDTAGSDFDTVIGVYTVEDDEFVQQACLDDVVSEAGYNNIAAVDFETIEDVAYYVQIGGFDGQYGFLKVAVR